MQNLYAGTFVTSMQKLGYQHFPSLHIFHHLWYVFIIYWNTYKCYANGYPALK